MKGTIRKQDNGRYYVATHHVDPATGKWKQKGHGGYRTKKEAERALRDVLGAMDDGTYVPKATRTLGGYLVDEWLPSKKTSVRESTLHSYERIITLHVVPRLGEVQLQQVTAPMLNGFYADLVTGGRRDGGGLAPRTVRYVHMILRQALGDASRWGYVVRNVALDAKAPKAPSRAETTMTTWDPQQVRAFLEHVGEDWLYPAFDLAASTGMRRGEVLGLRWEDVDLDAGQLQVCQQLTRIDYRLVFGPPKTDRGRRTVPLPGTTVAACGPSGAVRPRPGCW